MSQITKFIATAGPGSGTVTSVSGGNNITITGNPSINPTVNVSGTTNHAILLGNATGSIASLAVATNGQLPIGSTGADPVLATITAGTGISVTNGAGSITIAATGGGGGASSFPTDSGTATESGGSLTIDAGLASVICGATVQFVGSGSEVQLNVTSSGLANGNTLIGTNCGQFWEQGSLFNTGVGYAALNSNSTDTLSGSSNCAFGAQAGFQMTSGGENCAFGASSLENEATGSNNCAFGNGSLQFQSSASNNCAFGAQSLNNTGTASNNCVFGFQAASNYSGAEDSNIIIGNPGVASESNTIRIGTSGTGSQLQNQCFIAGINGITVTGTAVLVSSSDQLGIAVSSRKFKDNIKDMDTQSEDLHKLRPVSFTYKQSSETRYGLIAEEVAEIYPNLVVYDKQGDPQTVMYHELPALLLNEIQKLKKEIEQLKKSK